MNKLIRLERNFMFCDIFNQERNVGKFEKFVSVYFNIDYNLVHNHLKLVPRKLSKDKLKEAWKEVDLLLELPSELLKINIEINDQSQQAKMDRNLIYACKISSSNYKEGDRNYKNIYTTRQINFNIKDSNNDKLITEYVIQEKESKKVLSKKLQIDAINVAKTNDICYNSLNEKEKLIYNFCKLLSTEDEEEFRRVSELIMDEKESKDLLDQVKDKSSDDEYVYMESTFKDQAEYEEYMKEIITKEATEEGLKKGIEQGIEQEKLETAKKMLDDNLSLEMISKYTNLSIEEIQTLKDSK